MKYLRHPVTAALIMCAIMFFNIAHLAQEYMRITGAQSSARVYGSLLALDLGVLLFAVHGKRALSALFALGICAVNLSYFLAHAHDNSAIAIGVVFSLLYSGGIYAFSEIFVSELEHKADLADAQERIVQYIKNDQTQKQQIEAMKRTIADIKANAAELQQQLADMTQELKLREERHQQILARVEEIKAEREGLITKLEKQGADASDAPLPRPSFRKPEPKPQTLTYKKFGQRGEPVPSNIITAVREKAPEFFDQITAYTDVRQLNDKYRRLAQKAEAGKLNGEEPLFRLLQQL